MIFLAAFALTAGLVRMVAPYVKDLAAAKELAKPDMTYTEVARKVVPVDGIWAPAELPDVIDALNGKDNGMLEIGKERMDAAIRGGCPHCPSCKKLFPAGAPPACDRCGHKIDPSTG